MQDRGIDLDAPAIRRTRSWRWLKVRIDGLLSVPPVIVWDPWRRVHYVPQSRVGLALDPPDTSPPNQNAAGEDD